MTSASAPYNSLRQTPCHASQASSLVLMGCGSKLLKTSNLQRFTKVFTFVFLFVFWPYTAWAQSFTYNGNDYATLEAVFADISGTGTFAITVNDDAGTLGGVCTIADGQTVHIMSAASGTQRTVTRNASTAQISIASGGTLQMTDIILDGGSTAATPIIASVSLIENASTNTLTLNNCKFQNCKRYSEAQGMGVTAGYLNGGCLYSSVALTISGNAIFSNCTTELTNTNKSMYTSGNGGGIYAKGQVSISGNAVFSNCESKVTQNLTGGSSYGYSFDNNGNGGGIYSLEGVSITGDAIFTNCKSNTFKRRDRLTDRDYCFDDNTQSRDDDVYFNGCGGGIFAQGDNISISGKSTFTSCYACYYTEYGAGGNRYVGGCGGGVFSAANVILSGDVSFNSCKSEIIGIVSHKSNDHNYGCGGGIFSGGNMSFGGDASISNCSAIYGDGGGIHCRSTITVSSGSTVNFSNNVANEGTNYGAQGGALWVSYGGLVVNGATVCFSGNTVSGDACSGGGMCGTLKVNGGSVIFTNNTAFDVGDHFTRYFQEGGGGLAGVLIVNDGTVSFSGNTTNWCGGGLNGDFEVNGGSLSFTNNTAERGGAAFVRREGISNTSTANVVIGGGPGLGNTAQEGGGIYLANRDIGIHFVCTLNGLTITYNSAVRGGGIYSEKESNYSNQTDKYLSNHISHNEAQYGGGIYQRYGDLIMSGNTISNNIATKQGGGIFFIDINSAYGVKLNGINTISNNTAGNYGDGEGGGGIYAGCKNNNNDSTDDRIPVLLDGVTLSGNTAHGRGGGIYVAEEDGVYWSWISNSWKGPSVLVRNCNITGNQALADPSNSTHDLGNGGGIYAHGSKIPSSDPYTDGYLKVVGGTIAGNRALRNGCPLDHYCIGNGGGVYAYSGTVMLSDVNIGTSGNANTAYRNGGGVFVNEHADVTINGTTTVAHNTAVNGAGIYTLGNLTMDGSAFTVSNNTATGYGGGINLSHADVNDPEEIGFEGWLNYCILPGETGFINPGEFRYKIYNSSNIQVGDFPFDGNDYEDLLAPGTYTVKLSKTDGLSDFSSLTSLTLAISDIDGSITPNGGAAIANEAEVTFATFTDGYEICTFEVTSPADLGGTLTMKNGTTLSGNSAAYGGGLFVGTHTTAELLGATIGGSAADKNTATNVGGGIYKLGTLKVQGANTVTDNQSGTAKAIVTDNVYIPTTAAQPYVLVSGALDCGSRIGITKTKTDHTYLDDDNYTAVRTVIAQNEVSNSGHAATAYKRSVFFDDTDTYGVWCFNYPQSSHDDYSLDNCYFIETWRNFANASGFTGSGPYSVSSAAGLAYLAQQVNSGTDYAGTVINQTTDLDLSGHYWEPIGVSDPSGCPGATDNAFAGTYNGNGHFITGASSPLPYKDMGLFGNVTGTVKHVFVMGCDFTYTFNVLWGGHGGIVGKTTGVIDGCEASGITLTGNYTLYAANSTAGGIAGTVASGGEVRNSLTSDITTVHGASNSIVRAGGIAGNITSGGAVRNCYSKNNNLVGYEVGALVGNNEGTLANAYSDATTGTLVGTGTAGSNVYAAGATDATYTYTATIGADNLGYQYADNTVNSVAMFKQLSANATALGAGYAQWARPGLAEINEDLPVLLLDAYDGSVGGFSSVGTYNGSADVLQYGGTARDSDQVNTALTRTGTGTNCLFIYGDVTAAPTTAAASYTQSKVSIYEHASITAPGTLKDFAQTYVGVTFDNAAADAGIGAMSTDQMNGLGSQSLYRDWHMLSSPLSNAPIGFDYGSDNNGSGPQHNPWTGNDSWTRYWMQDYASADGYFPTSRGSLFTEGQVFISGSDEYNHRDVYQYGMDLYCWSEPDYHWINFKRNGNDHWSSEEPHNHIDYFGSGTNVNEGYLLEGKGYLASICKETFLQSHGSLNSGTDFKTRLNLTKNGAKCTGWNLVGNPFHSYLSFDALATANTAVLGTDALYVVYEAEGYNTSGNGTLGNGYLYYPYSGSPGGAYARPYLHPHQGFFVFAKSEGKLTFDESTMAMSRATVGANGNFRENRAAYPLVNLFLTSEHGCSDVCVVEFNRPEWGGAYKQKALRMGNGQLYAYHDGNEYAALFATAEAQRIPVYFEAKESDTYTLHWNTANGDFSQLILVDNMTGVQYDMLRNDSYSFSGTEDDYKSRFYICFAVLGMDEFEDDTSPGGTTFAFFDGSQWVVTNTGNGPAQLDLIDLQGRVLHRATLGEGGQTRVSLPEVAKGMYLLRRSSANGTQVQKIIIK